MSEHHDGEAGDHEVLGTESAGGSSEASTGQNADGGAAGSSSDDASSDDHEPASPGGTPVPGGDPYDLESDLGPDGVPTTEPEPSS